MDITAGGSSVAKSVTLKAATPNQWSSVISYDSGAIYAAGTIKVSIRLYSGSGSTRDNTYSYNVTSASSGSSSGETGGSTSYYSASYLEEANANTDILGQSQSFSIRRETSSLRHTVTYQCGDSSGTIISNSSSSSFSWTPPLTLAEQSTSSTIVNITLTCKTYYGGVLLGESTYSLSVDIPDSVKPSLSISLSDPTGYSATYGGYVQSRSKVRVTNAETLAYESYIASRRISVAGRSSTISPTDMELPTSGTIAVTSTITDGRGRSATATKNITVLPYVGPTVNEISAIRCNAIGQAKNDGEYIKVTFSAQITSLSNKNTASYAVKYKKLADEYYSSVAGGHGNEFSVTNASVIFAADADSAYNVYVQATDAFGPSSSAMVRVTSAGQVHLHIPGHGTSFAVGMLSTVREKFEEWWSARFYDDVQVDGTLSVEEDISVAGDMEITGDLSFVRNYESVSIFDMVYPIGSIYLSTQSTSPATIFGGTWEAIEDRFLLTSGDTYSAGSTGGNAAHTLTIAEMPSHSHTGSASEDGEHRHSYGQGSPNRAADGTKWNTAGSGASTYSDTTEYAGDHNHTITIGSTGGGNSFSIMPPYLVVYAWQRTA